MAFYIGQVGNPRDGFDEIREWLNNEEEVSQFLKAIEKGRDKVYGFKKAENLAQLLFDTNTFNSSSEEIAISNYKCLVERYGESLIKNEFPTESLNKELFDKLDEFHSHLEEAYYESLDETRADYDERKQDINQDYPEDADDGFWHISRDNG